MVYVCIDVNWIIVRFVSDRNFLIVLDIVLYRQNCICGCIVYVYFFQVVMYFVGFNGFKVQDFINYVQ